LRAQTLRDVLSELYAKLDDEPDFAAMIDTLGYGRDDRRLLELADRPEGLEAQAVSTGLLDILLPVRDLAALERAEQNEGEVTRLSERYGVVGVHMFCPSTPDAAAHCRNFAPLYAIPEEAATGTSNGALTYYLYRRGLTAAGAENRFVQGEKMGKPSEILSRLTDGGDGVKVQVGGRAVLALRCELL
nr:PhzF family phenazine biosynthesis protein [Flavonifractor sp.]